MRLNIPHAMHSPLMAPILPELRKAIEGCQPLDHVWNAPHVGKRASGGVQASCQVRLGIGMSIVLRLQPPCEQIAFISSLAGTKVSNALCDPSYWVSGSLRLVRCCS